MVPSWACCAVPGCSVLHPEYTDIVKLSLECSGKHSCLVLLDENPSVEKQERKGNEREREKERERERPEIDEN